MLSMKSDLALPLPYLPHPSSIRYGAHRIKSRVNGYHVPYRRDPLRHSRKPHLATARGVRSSHKRLTRQTRSIYEVPRMEFR